MKTSLRPMQSGVGRMVRRLVLFPIIMISRKPTSLILGNIVSISVAGQPLVILGSVEVANEMLDKKSAIYSDRPVMEMAGELSGFNKWTGFLGYGPRLKETRKYMHHAIGTRESLTEFSPLFESETRKFLKAVLRDPRNAQRYIRSYVVVFCYTRRGRVHVQFCRLVLQAQSLSSLHMAIKYKIRKIP